MTADEDNDRLATHAIRVSASAGLSLQRCGLVEVTGPHPGTNHPLTGERLVVGKSPDCDLCIPDATVSRQHFEVRNEAGAYLIKDLDSTNGTELDGARVREAYLRPGSLIKAGEVVFRFRTGYDPVQIAPSEKDGLGGLVGRSLRMREIFALIEKVAPSDATVLFEGGTGTGKGAAVAALHEHSLRKQGPLVVVDCGAVAHNLIESELFGHVKGAFTGATGSRKGALENSQGGTLYIDELDDLPLDLQPKLLRAIEERVFVRLGSNQSCKFDARLVASTKKELSAEVSAGRFREDLYYRLSVVTIRLPPLRERPDDIPLLFNHFAKESGASFEQLEQEVRDRWQNYSWPGNVRELRNAVERGRALQNDGLVQPSPVGSGAPAQGALLPDYALPFKDAKEKLLESFEREYLRRLLERVPDGISTAAREAKIDRKHLYNLLEKHGLDHTGKKEG
jgi:DNA-binding NtrC family response regulator